MGKSTAQGTEYTSPIGVVGEVSRLSTHQYSVGQWAEGKFLSWSGLQGWWAYKGVQGHEPCDYIVDTGPRILRVEVKGSIKTQRRDKTDYHAVINKMDKQKFDYLFVATPDGIFWIPGPLIGDTGQLSIGVERAGGSRNKWWRYKVG
jgi:hypothetical protein